MALSAGDLIRSVNGRPVKDLARLRAVLGSVGEAPLVVHVERNGRMAFLTLPGGSS